MRPLCVVGWLLRLGVTCAVLVATRAASADPSVDAAQACIKPSERGQSQRDEGKYREARQSFIQCARDVCPTVVVRMCLGWLHEIEQTEPTLVLGARDEQGHDVADVTVTFDGEPLASRLDGRPIEVDAGEHVLRFEREHSLPVEEKLILRAGEKARVVKVTFQSDTPSEPTPAPREVETPVPEPAPVAWPRHVTAGAMLLGAVGAAGAGVYFVVAANRDQQNAAQLRSALGSTAACSVSMTPDCQNLSNTVHAQHTDSNVATALFVGAGVLAVGSVVTWLAWPRPSDSRVATSTQTSAFVAPVPGGAVLSLVGSLP